MIRWLIFCLLLCQYILCFLYQSVFCSCSLYTGCDVLLRYCLANLVAIFFCCGFLLILNTDFTVGLPVPLYTYSSWLSICFPDYIELQYNFYMDWLLWIMFYVSAPIEHWQLTTSILFIIPCHSSFTRSQNVSSLTKFIQKSINIYDTKYILRLVF
jgi:hypothetical protein